MKITELVLKRLVKDNFNDFICFEDSEFKTFGNVVILELKGNDANKLLEFSKIVHANL
jgi:hypothetical protein